jgi:hypothetical protein
VLHSCTSQLSTPRGSSRHEPCSLIREGGTEGGTAPEVCCPQSRFRPLLGCDFSLGDICTSYAGRVLPQRNLTGVAVLHTGMLKYANLRVLCSSAGKGQVSQNLGSPCSASPLRLLQLGVHGRGM